MQTVCPGIHKVRVGAATRSAVVTCNYVIARRKSLRNSAGLHHPICCHALTQTHKMCRNSPRSWSSEPFCLPVHCHCSFAIVTSRTWRCACCALLRKIWSRAKTGPGEPFLVAKNCPLGQEMCPLLVRPYQEWSREYKHNENAMDTMDSFSDEAGDLMEEV